MPLTRPMPTTDTADRPRLAPHVRLTYDQARQRHVLLTPETVTLLNGAGAAILLGASRRQLAKHPLPPIRSLYYFLPILEELRNEPHDPDDLAYLERRLRATLDG